LFLVGWGPLETTLRMKARELGIADNIIFAGKCQQDRVFEILSITDIFVLSSLWEGFGLVLGEAMAMAKPVVCTKTDGSQVVVKHNETGIIVPPKDPRALADAVINLIGDPDRARKMGELGKERVAALFSPERFIQEHEAFYREII
jgi:glycosyltransferase involved in cell wall biosynthesis